MLTQLQLRDFVIVDRADLEFAPGMTALTGETGAGKSIIVDALGHRCPTPTLRLRRALERAPAGAVVRLLADDPLARIDIPHFAAEAGLELLGVTDADGVLAFTLRRPLSASNS